MESLILTFAGTGAQAPVVARRIRLELSPGTGRLHVADDPPTAADWRASVTSAWQAALHLAHGPGTPRVDARLHVASATPIAGMSAGLSVGLLALAALLDRPALPAHFATGGVLDPCTPPDRVGWLEGGRFTAQKARAATTFAPQLGLPDAVFLSPPVPGRSGSGGLPVRFATDLASAYAHLDPVGYRAIAARHEGLRRADALRIDDLDAHRPFALVHHRPGRDGRDWPRDVDGIQVVAADPRHRPTAHLPGSVLVRFGEARRLLWSAHLPDHPGTAGAIPALMELARAAGTPPATGATGDG